VRPRTIRELQLTWFDTISPEFDSTHSEEEVVGWFERERFTQIATLDEPKVGVRGVADGGGAQGFERSEMDRLEAAARDRTT
jgi:hypothetical protein